MSVRVTIEHGIPLPPPPPKKKKPISGLRWALVNMEIGDSFILRKYHVPAVKSAAIWTRTKIKIALLPDDIDMTGTLAGNPPGQMYRVWKMGVRG